MKSLKDLVQIFFSSTADSYDEIVNLTTFGKDSFWKYGILEQSSTEKTVSD